MWRRLIAFKLASQIHAALEAEGLSDRPLGYFTLDMKSSHNIYFFGVLFKQTGSIEYSL